MGEKITNPVIRDLIKAALIDEKARGELEAKIVSLTESLTGVTACLTVHLAQEAYELECGRAELCPCALGELKTAQDLLEEFI